MRASASLLARSEDLLPIDDARGILEQSGLIDRAEQNTLLSWLHELGDIVYYPDVEDLHNMVFLKPEWITRSVAAILDDQEVKDARGVLRRDHIERLWSNVTSELRKILTALMDHYDLTYATEISHERIVVECLQHKPTAYQSLWSARKDQPEIRIRYHFDPRFQPGIPTWFIARGHRYSTGNQWRQGVLFEDPDYNSACLMEADSERASVTLTVRGPNPPYFFGVILRTFNDTLKRYPGLKYVAYLPCRCGGRLGESACTHEWEYADLLDSGGGTEAVDKMQCPKTRKMVPLIQILNGVHFDSYRDIIDKLDRQAAGQLQILEEMRASFAQLQNQFTLDLVRKQNELDEDSPGVFTLYHPTFRSLESTGESWKRALLDVEGEELELCVFCEHPGEWHITQNSSYRFRPTAEWVEDVLPYWAPVQNVLKTCTPVLKAVAKAKFPFLPDALSRSLESAAEASTATNANRGDLLAKELGPNKSPTQVWEQARTKLRALIQDLDAKRKDPSSHWGGLRQTHTPSGEILWLCPEHKAKTFPFTGR